ncbi:hypothetical protein [Moritella sp. F3]|uniref:hypothetical protein n=1 Tax=Moritella sp. F3 TaxID=2718882 RepID=UPI0018E17497|nr:hypothetical protein [Moritella sp. F3]GIC79490.1 hypothetical protein FMO001_42170 [Moritella sp. F1]GIC79768.1 hypothetical protein FMO003_00490 [Moritella sp. F3]
MPLIFTGFEEVNPSLSIPSQILELELINTPSISVVAGRNNEGQALRTTNGSYIQCRLPTQSSKRAVEIGAAFKYTNETSNNVLIQVCHATEPTLSTDHEAQPSAHVAVIYIKDGYLCVAYKGSNKQLIKLTENEYTYVEIRFYFCKYADVYAISSAIFVNGLNVLDMGRIESSSSIYDTVVYFAAASGDMQIDIDHLYMFTDDSNLKNQYLPILASGKISTLALSTVSNTFAVTENNTDVALALSDNSDDTYISSTLPADAVLSVNDSNISNVYALKMATRGKSETTGVTVLSLEDSNGKDILRENAVAFTRGLSSYSFPAEVSTNSKTTADKINSGALLRIKT